MLPPPPPATAGYEEAAAQGLVAGLNAARRAAGAEPVMLPRESSYIGTLLDDLVTKDLREPYRMLTSRWVGGLCDSALPPPACLHPATQPHASTAPIPSTPHPPLYSPSCRLPQV